MQEFQWDFIVFSLISLTFPGFGERTLKIRVPVFVRPCIIYMLYRVLLLWHRTPLSPVTSSDSRGANFNDERYKF